MKQLHESYLPNALHPEILFKVVLYQLKEQVSDDHL